MPFNVKINIFERRLCEFVAFASQTALEFQGVHGFVSVGISSPVFREELSEAPYNV